MIKKLKFKSKFSFGIFSISSISALILSACSNVLTSQPENSNNHSEQGSSGVNSDANASSKTFPQMDGGKPSNKSSKITPPRLNLGLPNLLSQNLILNIKMMLKKMIIITSVMLL
ncbi:hypothetical protein J2Z62_000478 [Mycoplasmoides fastidiosum]|uniref:Lipoprotein n=1 Tax=Mycoplasmoides fastidiosum TaxID=92758 RepID=A0ABU0LZA4_9BACT|nr:hypothetical protein [Mycoplasmoides fastidiosum]MDQ0514040.1 hypothetical protein [Mycoplasmoides fastidiosum]UUD37552.1 hypothetical protein NPA10_03215 [Mycoplasmoides fastidiosum]